MDLLARHVANFNEGVRTGDFSAMLELFEDDAEFVFEGVPVGPFHGKDAIARAYTERPPDDEIEVLETERANATIVARYGWRVDGGTPAGRLIITPRGDRIARLVVTFE